MPVRFPEGDVKSLVLRIKSEQSQTLGNLVELSMRQSCMFNIGDGRFLVMPSPRLNMLGFAKSGQSVEVDTFWHLGSEAAAS